MIGRGSKYCEIHQHHQFANDEPIPGPSPTQQDIGVKTRRAAQNLLKNKLIEDTSVSPPDWEGCRDMTKIPKIYDVRMF